MRGHQAVDAAREVRRMNGTRVAFHASKPEADAWIADQTGAAREHAPEDLRAAWRASLEALGITVEE